jgi:hypothetical protein
MKKLFVAFVETATARYNYISINTEPQDNGKGEMASKPSSSTYIGDGRNRVR